MNEVPINQPLLEVQATFRDGQLHPTKIAWGVNELTVDNIVERWNDYDLDHIAMN